MARLLDVDCTRDPTAPDGRLAVRLAGTGAARCQRVPPRREPGTQGTVARSSDAVERPSTATSRSHRTPVLSHHSADIDSPGIDSGRDQLLVPPVSAAHPHRLARPTRTRGSRLPDGREPPAAPPAR